jgi:hypothetical protein
MATNYYHGLNIRWGTGTTTSTAFGASAIIQTIDVEQKVDELEVKNQYGSTVGWVGFDAKKEATFEYVAADSTSPPTGTATVTQPTQGDMITVSGGETVVNGTIWIVKNVVEKEMNTDATKVTVRATLYPLISV